MLFYRLFVGAGRGAVELEPVSRAPAGGAGAAVGGEQQKPLFGFTGVMTHTRFSPLNNVKDFKPRDIISIGKMYVTLYDLSTNSSTHVCSCCF